MIGLSVGIDTLYFGKLTWTAFNFVKVIKFLISKHQLHFSSMQLRINRHNMEFIVQCGILQQRFQ